MSSLFMLRASFFRYCKLWSKRIIQACYRTKLPKGKKMCGGKRVASVAMEYMEAQVCWDQISRWNHISTLRIMWIECDLFSALIQSSGLARKFCTCTYNVAQLKLHIVACESSHAAKGKPSTRQVVRVLERCEIS